MQNEEKINLELYKDVEKVNLLDILPSNSFPPGFTHAIIDSYGNYLNICSEKYNIIHNRDIYIPFEEELQKNNIPFTRKVNTINKSKFYVDYIIRDRIKTASINDVFPKISIWNSYDGILKFRIEIGFHKLICSNGLTRPTKKLTSNMMKHSTGSIGFETIKNTIKETKLFLDESKNDMDIFETMNQTEVTIETLNFLGKKSGISTRMMRVALERLNLEVKGGSTYENEYGELVNHDCSPESLFTAYNAINYAIYNTNKKELPEDKLKKDRKLIQVVEKYMN